jgi:hypothetical protein
MAPLSASGAATVAISLQGVALGLHWDCTEGTCSVQPRWWGQCRMCPNNYHIADVIFRVSWGIYQCYDEFLLTVIASWLSRLLMAFIFLFFLRFLYTKTNFFIVICVVPTPFQPTYKRFIFLTIIPLIKP